MIVFQIYIFISLEVEKEYLNFIKGIIADKSVKLSFSFHGWLTRDNAMELIKRINGIMIFPSISDNFNLSFLSLFY